LMGVLVLAAITSFPEVWTSIATVTHLDAPDIGIGDLIGSVIINLMIIVALDFKYAKGPILSSVKRYHLLTCGFSLATLGIVIAAFALNIFTENSPGLFNIGLESYIIFALCIAGIYASTRSPEELSAKKGRTITKDPILRKYAALSVCAGIIIASGFWLAWIGKEIVDMKGWDQMYFGTIVIAFTTSLPEIVVSLAAISIGSPDMALANILGSNLFNIFIIPVMDLIYQKGYILGYVSVSHLYSTLLAIILTSVVFFGILYRPKRSFMRLGIGTIISIAIFLSGNYLLYQMINR
ncbi:MAG: hypothetical protein ABH875_04565, partial [Candidatus Omnitrophota bacterium]